MTARSSAIADERAMLHVNLQLLWTRVKRQHQTKI